jgi:hypothetical protein
MKTGLFSKKTSKVTMYSDDFEEAGFRYWGTTVKSVSGGKRVYKRFVISPTEVTLDRIGGYDLKLADHFCWPRHVDVASN